MNVTITSPDGNAPETEVDVPDGGSIVVPPGSTVSFPGEAPVAGVPVGNDFYVYFADGTVMILKDFFGFGEGAPPEIYLGEGNSFFADYGFEPDEGPVGFLFGEGVQFSLTGFEPGPLFSNSGFSFYQVLLALGEEPGLMDPLEVTSDGLEPGGEEAFELVPGFLCSGGPLVRSGSGVLSLSECDDIFTITERALNSIEGLEGDDVLTASFAADVQYNLLVGGLGSDDLFLIASGVDGDVEFNDLVGDGLLGAGADRLLVRAIDPDGDARLNTLTGGDGNDLLSAEAYRDIEFSTFDAGTGDDTIYAYAGRVFTGTELGSAVALDFVGDGFGFTYLNEGVRLNVVDLPADLEPQPDNIAWAEGPGDAVLAFDRDGDGEITALDEIDFRGDFAGATTSFEGLVGFDSNGDGFLTDGDAAFDLDRWFAWVEGNDDGKGSGAELTSFTDLGITSFGLSLDPAIGAYAEGDAIVNGIGGTAGIGGFTIAAGVGLVADFFFLGAPGGEHSGREDLQNNVFLAGDGVDTVTARAHQDVQGNTVIGGEGNDTITLQSLIDDLFINEVFGDDGVDVIRAYSFENNYDNAFIGGTGGDGIALTGDRIIRNVVVGGDDSDEVEYEVTADGLGNWTLDTETAVPLSGSIGSLAGVFFDVRAGVVGAMVSTTEQAGVTGGHVVVAGVGQLPDSTVMVELDLNQDGVADAVYEVMSDATGAWTIDTASPAPAVLVSGEFTELPGARFDVNATIVGSTVTTTETSESGGDVVLSGIADLPNSSVTVGLDMDRDGTVDVEFEVTADGPGNWTLDTAAVFPSRGSFVPPSAGQSFDVTATPFAFDKIISNEAGTAFPVNGEDLSDASSESLDILSVDSLDGTPLVSGSSFLPGATVTVGLDVVADGDGADFIALTATGEIEGNEISGNAGGDVITMGVTGAPFDRPAIDGDVSIPFSGGVNRNEVRGRSGDDRVEVTVNGTDFGATANTLSGGTENDILSLSTGGERGTASLNRLDGGTGNNHLLIEVTGLESDATDNSLIAGDGVNSARVRAYRNAQDNTLEGGENGDTLEVESTGADGGGVVAFNLIEGRGGNDEILVRSEASYVYSNTVAAGDGDDTVAIGGAGAFWSVGFGLGFNDIDGGDGVDTLRILDAGESPGDTLGDITTAGNARNFEVLDMTNDAILSNLLLPSITFFDDLTGFDLASFNPATDESPLLTVLGDGGVDIVELAGDWTFLENDLATGNRVYVEATLEPDLTISTGVRLLSLQADLIISDALVAPVVLDLGGDGFAFERAGAGMVFDLDGNGTLEEVAWASSEDAVLVFDRDGDGLITERMEFAFADYLEDAETDLEGLRFFDTNANGLLDAGDADFESFFLWQESNFDGVGSGGELTSLADSGIKSIGLETAEGSGFTDGDVIVHGVGEFTTTEGATGALADAAFLYRYSAEVLDFSGVGEDREEVAAISGGDDAPGTGIRADDVLDLAHADYAGALVGVELLGDTGGPAAEFMALRPPGSARANADAVPAPWEEGAGLVEGEAPPDDGIALI